VRNLGQPVELAQRYFAEGADEVTFLNITGFRDFPLSDLPMLEARAGAARHMWPVENLAVIWHVYGSSGKHHCWFNCIGHSL